MSIQIYFYYCFGETKRTIFPSPSSDQVLKQAQKSNLLLRYSGASPNRSSAQQTDFFRFFRWIPLPLQMEPLKSSCITWFISGVICDEIITCCALYTIKLDVLMLHTSQHQRYRTVFTTGLRERLGYKCAATSLWLLHISRCCDEF